MTTWASHHFDSCCSETVFPVPKPPGIAAVPPFAIGNRKSMTRWPVMSGTLGIIRFFVGRGWRTGQSCFIVSLRPPSSSATTSSTFRFPDRMRVIFPVTFGGTRTRCSPFFASWTVPTSTTSYIRGFRPMAVTTGPATRWIVPLPLISVVTFALAATSPTSLEQVHADRSLHLRAQVFVLRRADRDHDRPRDGLEPPSHRVAQALHVCGVQHQDAYLGVVEDRRDLLLDFLPRARDSASHADQLETLNEVVPAHRSDLHLTPPRALGSRRSRAGFLSRGR